MKEIEDKHIRKSQFVSLLKGLFRDKEEGYYGMTEIADEIWTHFEDEQSRNKKLWKEIQRLRKKVTNIK